MHQVLRRVLTTPILFTVSRVQNLALEQVVPVGIRNEDGTVIPLSLEEQHKALGDPAEAHYSGRLESVPACIGQLVRITSHHCRNSSKYGYRPGGVNIQERTCRRHRSLPKRK